MVNNNDITNSQHSNDFIITNVIFICYLLFLFICYCYDAIMVVINIVIICLTIIINFTIKGLCPSAAIWRRKTWSALVQVTTCHLFVARPLP